MLDTIQRAYQYALADPATFGDALSEHLQLVGVALGLAMLLGIPAGGLTARSRLAAAGLITTFNALRVIPSLAVLFLAIPYFGLSFTSAVLALVLLALPPVVINTDLAFRLVARPVREAALGMGMTARQLLWRVEVPLALPLIVAGVRTAALEVIASATLAAFIGAGGLGLYITRGFAMYDSAILLVGALPVAALALGAELALGAIQRVLQAQAGLQSNSNA